MRSAVRVAILAACATSPIAVLGQAGPASEPRTPWGDPDLQGNANADRLRLVERFRRTGPDTLEWSVTVDDPSTWSRPWTFSMPLTGNDEEAVELYECHEGNHAIFDILSAARAAEREAASRQSR